MTNRSNAPNLFPSEGKQEIPKRPHRFTLERVYPALVFIPLFYLAVRHLSPIVFFLLIVIVGSLAFLEFIKVSISPSPSTLTMIMSMGSVWLLLAVLQWTDYLLPTIALTLLVISLLLIFMFVPQRLKQLLPKPLAILFGIIYIGICIGHLLLIRKLELGAFLIFFVLAVTWAADTGGYYVGASLGKRPIAPRLSPKKTIEGFVAGMLFSVAFALICHFWFLQTIPISDSIIIGILLACVGLLGDLAESAFKRSAGVKDSGSLIPGHGGILDRIDSLLLTAPVFYYYVLLFIKD